ncbi:MAG: hypothetical protein P1U56_20820 [Saprospiraceae bacterium]|nr:hypothetical protein [Saprospiraceae bacterium]
MFKKQLISTPTVVQFWKSKSTASKQLQLDGPLFQFTTAKNKSIITIKNKRGILNPKTDFIQALITKNDTNQDIIIVETKPFILRLYRIIYILIAIFGVLQLKTNVLLVVVIFIIFGLIFLYNYKKINSSIEDFKSLLEIPST